MKFSPRIVQNNLLISKDLTIARFQVDPKFTYVGNTSFILYNVAHVEQHHFVIANSANRVERLLWYQFEGYLDNNKHKYNYSGMEALSINGLDFLHDADVLNIDDDYKERPTSDSAHVVDYLNKMGYVMQGDVMFKRMVWLDADLRNELMIIYSEDLRPTGYRVTDLAEGGVAANERESLFKDLHERALSNFSVI